MPLLSRLLIGDDLSDYNEKKVVTLNTSRRQPVILLVDTSSSMQKYENLLKNFV